MDDRGAPSIESERPFFFGMGNFGVIHRPLIRNLPGWVVCSPFGKERDRTHRLGVEWARFLAAEGHWVLRFDYRGSGDSLGEFEDYSISDYLGDTAAAVAALESQSGMACRGITGLRLGADLAAAFAAETDRALDLVMWEPIVKGKRYRNTLLRTAMANEMMVSKGAHRSRDDFKGELAQGRTVSVDGFSLSPRMYDSLEAIDSVAIGRPTFGPILVVQMKAGRGRAPTPAVARLSEVYGTGGDFRLDSVEASPVWMDTRTFRWPPDDLFDRTFSWIESRPQPESGVPGDPVDGAPVKESPTEKTVGFEVDGDKVWGILHEPAGAENHTPVIVFLHAGDTCRAAFFYPRLARFLAEKGWRVLRFDPRGLGDSQGDQNCEWLLDFFDKVERGDMKRDAVSALDYLEAEFGVRSAVLLGLCGGAITAIYAAQDDDRVVGVAPLDLPLTLFRPAIWDQQEVSWLEVFSQRRSTLVLVKIYHFFSLIKGAAYRSGKFLRGPFLGDTEGSSWGKEWYEKEIGKNANFSLLAAVEKTLDRGIPVRCVFAGSTDHLQNFETVLPGLNALSPLSKEFLDYSVIEGADHNFVMPGCTEELFEVISDWLMEQFARSG